MTKRILLFVMAAFYVAAGANHFAKPDVYMPMMPPYLPCHHALILLSGAAEVVLGLTVLIPALRHAAASASFPTQAMRLPRMATARAKGRCGSDVKTLPLIIKISAIGIPPAFVTLFNSLNPAFAVGAGARTGVFTGTLATHSPNTTFLKPAAFARA